MNEIYDSPYELYDEAKKTVNKFYKLIEKSSNPEVGEYSITVFQVVNVDLDIEHDDPDRAISYSIRGYKIYTQCNDCIGNSICAEKTYYGFEHYIFKDAIEITKEKFNEFISNYYNPIEKFVEELKKY